MESENDLLSDITPPFQSARDPVQAAIADIRRSLSIAPTLFVMHIRARRRANLLGWLWLMLPTVVTLGVGLSVQNHGVFQPPRTQLPYAIFVTVGVAIWQSFAEAVTMPLRQFGRYRYQITRTRMPLEAPILAGVLEVAMAATIRIVFVLGLLSFLDVHAGISLFALPIMLGGLIALGAAVGMVAAPVGLIVEDVGRAIIILVGVWMLATPVAYPIPPALALLNPTAPLLDAARGALTGQPVPLSAYLVSALGGAALIPALFWMRLSRSHLIDRVT